jgi:uncharacterized protein (UPF0216 family)
MLETLLMEFTMNVIKTVCENWTEYRNEQGQLHREDGPAVELPDGSKVYYQNNLLHRNDGPAVELADGTKIYYQNNERHRDNGPAVIWHNGKVEYWLNGVRQS